MSEPQEGFPLLHVHAQGAWHQEAYVVGNVQGLVALRDAIQTALGQLQQRPNGQGEATVYVADGEGYDVVVILDDTAWEGDAWTRAAVPYWKTHAKERRREALWPWHRVRPASAEGGRDAAADRPG